MNYFVVSELVFVVVCVFNKLKMLCENVCSWLLKYLEYVFIGLLFVVFGKVGEVQDNVCVILCMFIENGYQLLL